MPDRDGALHGRVEERAAIDSLLEQACRGRGGCLVLRGEPGIGKTALLEYAAERAGGMRVLHTAGAEPEADLGYATLHRLLLPVLDRIGALPAPHARALGAVFGQVSGPAPDRFLPASATLRLLSEVAGERPVLCLVDDAHWADGPSLDALAYAARRLDAEPIAVAFATRADEGWPLGAAGLIEAPLAGLDRDAAQALLASLCGRAREARELAEDVLVEAGKRNQAGAAATAYRALGLLDLAAGRSSEAADRFQAMALSGGATHPGIVLSALPDLVEAAVRAGQADRVAEPLDRFARWAEATRSPDLRALTARCQALLATGEAAEAEYRLALALHASTDAPMELARTRLLFGEHLRRNRRRCDARPHLRAALEGFRRLGASAWADRARDELRATGEAAPAGAAGLMRLTPQERRITAAVGEGATNREIAAQLFLSPRTVDCHLRKVFQKTAVSSRAELIRLVHADGGDTPAPR